MCCVHRGLPSFFLWIKSGDNPTICVLKWLFGCVERTLLTLLGSDMVLRWLVFFFKD